MPGVNSCITPLNTAVVLRCALDRAVAEGSGRGARAKLPLSGGVGDADAALMALALPARSRTANLPVLAAAVEHLARAPA